MTGFLWRGLVIAVLLLVPLAYLAYLIHDRDRPIEIPPVAKLDSPFCSEQSVGDIGYIVCTIDPRRNAINLHHAGVDGKPWGDVAAFAAYEKSQGQALSLAMNAGMYHEDLSPVGLLVEDGKELAPLNTASGFGNFFLKPNGVFYIDQDRKAGVMETEAYEAAGLSPRLATQSGPIMLIGGALHPRFLTDGTSKYIRNGVGVRADGMVIFAISRQPVNFYEFAVAFRDSFGCPDALFLDGSVSTLYAGGQLFASGTYPAGTVLAVTGE